MEGEPELCEGCGERRVVLDAVSGLLCCEACGQLQDEATAQLDAIFQIGHVIERGGTVVHYGDTGEKAAYSAARGRVMPRDWTSRKKVDLMKKVEYLAGVLRVPSDTVNTANHMLECATEGQWGMGRWTDILVGACIYAAARQAHLPLSIVEVADAMEGDVKELGRMYNRVLKALELKLPDEDLFLFLDRAMSSITVAMKIEKEEARRLTKQGRLLLEYASQWFITTGRRSLPVVAAVMLFVMEANQLDIGINEVSKELHATIATTKNRYKEFQEALIKVAQRLPWGKDVTPKTLSCHLPFLLQYLEASKRLHKQDSNTDEFNRAKRLKANENTTTNENLVFVDQQDNDVSAQNCSARISFENPEQNEENSSKVETNSLASAKVLFDGQQRPCEMLPRAFLASEHSRSRRRTKINRAKMRIADTKQDLGSKFSVFPLKSALQRTKDGDISSTVHKHPNMTQGGKLCKPNEGLDREDIVIECLLLHGANESQVEEGHYRSICDQLFSDSNGEISDQDLAQYIRSQSEVDLYAELVEHSMESPWG
ncbi:hypothetical protein O6H91_08G043900 [Diphasiastrum complanatum]|uniref:Uncharacterized protein n=1 Tax=Diphasiastrum complanatum TaxID=34168 RepID=A0ACC2CX17_DIPCM|nr:hypothetical protein O6H91_08G043900 [Diphasiastrum complanatum]